MIGPRVLPTAALVGVAALVASPVAIALRMMTNQNQSASGSKKAAAGKAAVLAGFDGERAYKYLVEQCQIGPRISGTEGNRKLRRRLAEHFESCGAKIQLQQFEVRHPLTREPVQMENVVASWNPQRKRRVLVGAHFDTRPHPDRETDPRKKAAPFLGANDGASGVAVLMELANLMPELRTTAGVDFVCFDGEELVFGEDRGEYFLGSIHFAELYRQGRSEGRYAGAIVIDMIGDKSLQIYPDQVSQQEAQQLVREVWDIAKRLGATGFKSGRGHDIRDDHLALLDVGIPAIDLIDFDYGPDNRYWHTTEDTSDKCSAASLAQVGGVLAEWLRGR